VRLTQTGQPLLGVASKVCPINASRMARQVGSDATGWSIETADFDGAHAIKETEHGAQWLRGGGNVWAALAPGGVKVRGNVTIDEDGKVQNDGLFLPDDNVLDVGPDGLVYVTTYQTGTDIRAYHADPHLSGQPLLTLATPPILYDATAGPQVSALKGLRLAWLAGAVQTHGLAGFVARAEHVNSLRLAETPTQVYIVERGHDWLMVRPIDSLEGWQIDGDGEHFFSPDLVALDDVHLVVGWSDSQGEGPYAGRTQQIDTRWPRKALVRPEPPVIVIPPVEPPQPEPPIVIPPEPPVIEPPPVEPPVVNPEPPREPWWRALIAAILRAWWEGRK